MEDVSKFSIKTQVTMIQVIMMIEEVTTQATALLVLQIQARTIPAVTVMKKTTQKVTMRSQMTRKVLVMTQNRKIK